MMGSLCSADVTPVRSGRSGSGRSGRSGSSRSSRSGSGRSGPVPVGPVGPVPVGPVRFRSVRSVRFRSVLFFYMSNCRVKNAALGRGCENQSKSELVKRGTGCIPSTREGYETPNVSNVSKARSRSRFRMWGLADCNLTRK